MRFNLRQKQSKSTTMGLPYPGHACMVSTRQMTCVHTGFERDHG